MGNATGKRKKRTPTKGYVYLLKASNNDTMTGWPVYKYGCSRQNVRKRIKAANACRHFTDPDFHIIALYESSDIFADERDVAYKIITSGFGVMCEFVCVEDEDASSQIEAQFRKALKRRKEVL